MVFGERTTATTGQTFVIVLLFQIYPFLSGVGAGSISYHRPSLGGRDPFDFTNFFWMIGSISLCFQRLICWVGEFLCGQPFLIALRFMDVILFMPVSTIGFHPFDVITFPFLRVIPANIIWSTFARTHHTTSSPVPLSGLAFWARFPVIKSPIVCDSQLS